MSTPVPDMQAAPDPSSFKRAARNFVSGVTVVTTTVTDDRVYGVTVSSFASLSLNPLLITVSLLSESRMLRYAKESGHFAVSVLAEDQADVSAYFATMGREPAPGFGSIPTVIEQTGAPIIDGCLAHFDCRVHTVLPGGDHEILVGSVVSAGGSSGKPLLYYDGGYRSIDAEDGPSSEERLADGVAVQLQLADLSPQEITSAQAALDPAAAQLAADNATEADLASLTTIVDAAEEALDDPVRFTELGTRFHVAVALASGNRVLSAALQALRQNQQALFAPRNDHTKALRAHVFHRQLLEHIRNHDGEQARAVMASHVGRVAAGIANPTSEAPANPMRRPYQT